MFCQFFKKPTEWQSSFGNELWRAFSHSLVPKWLLIIKYRFKEYLFGVSFVKYVFQFKDYKRTRNPFEKGWSKIAVRCCILANETPFSFCLATALSNSKISMFAYPDIIPTTYVGFMKKTCNNNNRLTKRLCHCIFCQISRKK